eukprot:2837303-Pyramimonas_sp.AAC.1
MSSRSVAMGCRHSPWRKRCIQAASSCPKLCCAALSTAVFWKGHALSQSGARAEWWKHGHGWDVC